jgi:hypothetical protein
MATDTIQRPPSGFGTFVWALFYFFVFTVAALLLMRNFGPKSGAAYEDTRGEERLKLREKVVNDANLKLNTVGMVDPAKGIVHIPITEAKKAVIADLKAKKVGASAVKVDAWLPMPPPADPNAAEPPPPALTSAPQGADTIRFETPAPAK